MSERMTDLERARELIAFASYSESPVGHVKRVAAALAAARREGGEAALRAALPAEFYAETEALMRKAYGDAARTGRNPHLAVYRALRAHLLGDAA